MPRIHARTFLKLAAALAIVAGMSCAEKTRTVAKEPEVLSPKVLEEHCREIIGEPRVERISEHVWDAVSFDLANTVLIHTDDGNVIVDTAMSIPRAREIRAALEKVAPKAPVKAIIFTHSHIDHIGGAAVWAESGTKIWATDAFVNHFFKQYGLFRPAETARGMRQFGYGVSPENLPCSSIGRNADIALAVDSGLRLPTDTFFGIEILDIGGLKIELHEAHGETHDQLFVWIPQDKTLIPGDNFYWTFPNLYTIRGTSPRPVNDWIKSLDAMRRLGAEHLAPTHTKPIHGEAEIADALTNYRDAIQWVRDEVVRRANAGQDIDTLAESIQLPPHLADKRYLMQLYGQVDWSARAIYTNDLGWFDGMADKIYPVPHEEAERREVTLMGGPEKILEMAAKSLEAGDSRWAIHLLAKLRDSGLATGDTEKLMDKLLEDGYRKLAETIANSNGRAYLLVSALELEGEIKPPATPNLDESVVAKIPLSIIFNIMASRIDVEKAADELSSVQFVFPDENTKFVVTIRRGIVEVIEGEPLPGTPEPIAVLTTDAQTYRKLALGLMGQAAALASGKVKIKGNQVAFLKFMGMFRTGI